MNLACANKQCKAELKYLRGGRLFLMERRPQASFRAGGDADPQKHSVAMRRYFWLCESCAEQFVVHRWTESGVQLALRHAKKTPQSYPPRQVRDWMMPGLVG